MKHTQHGSVTLTITEKPINELQSTYIFSVKDTGAGIPENELAHIFSRFYQGEKNKGYGLGLGLSITQRFTEMMGGSITVNSELGVGSHFTCTIPIMLSEKPLAIINPFVQPAEKPKILLVEDNELIQAMTVQTLKKLDWRYELASTGEDALLAWRKRNISLILLDLGLPDQSGLDVLQTIRQSDKTTPIITLTGDATEKTKKLCEEKGATGFLAKPASQEELLQAINEAMQKTTEP
jgi:CheY-like chemotaxis protein